MFLIALYLRLSFKSIKCECYSYGHVSPASHTNSLLFLVVRLQNPWRETINGNCYVLPHTSVKQVYPPTKVHMELKHNPRINSLGPAKSLLSFYLLSMKDLSPLKMHQLVSWLSLRLSRTLSVNVIQPGPAVCLLSLLTFPPSVNQSSFSDVGHATVNFGGRAKRTGGERHEIIK